MAGAEHSCCVRVSVCVSVSVVEVEDRDSRLVVAFWMEDAVNWDMTDIVLYCIVLYWM